MDDGAGARAPVDVIETSRKRSAEDAGYGTDDADRGGVQHDSGSMANDSMHEAMWDAGGLGANAAALAETHLPARFQRRAGASGFSAGVAMELRMGWVTLTDAAPAHFESHVLGFLPVAGVQHKARRKSRTAVSGHASLGVCLQFSTTAGRGRWTRSL